MNGHVAAIQAAWERSTTGEWKGDPHFWGAEAHILDSNGFIEKVIARHDGSRLFEDVGEQAVRDMQFIATAHNHWPDVMAYIRQLEAQLAKGEQS